MLRTTYLSLTHISPKSSLSNFQANILPTYPALVLILFMLQAPREETLLSQSINEMACDLYSFYLMAISGWFS